MSVVNPYEFLGVNENSTMTQVRRAFFELSLICHPDKGGNTADMRTLQSAYEWICHHISTVRGRDGGDETYEEKEENFKLFLEEQQQEKILSWDQIIVLDLAEGEFDTLFDRYKRGNEDDFVKRLVTYQFCSRLQNSENPTEQLKDALMKMCLNEFHERGQHSSWYHAAIQDGYGEFLQSMPEDITAPIEAAKSFGRQEMILYQEPIALPPRPTGADACPVEKLDDYSVGAMCDYRLAFQDANKPLEQLQESMRGMFVSDVNERFEQLRNQYNQENP